MIPGNARIPAAGYPLYRHITGISSVDSVLFSPIENLCENGQQKQAERKDKDNQGGDIDGQTSQMGLQLNDLRRSPFTLVVSPLHQQLREIRKMLTLTQDQRPVLREVPFQKHRDHRESFYMDHIPKSNP
jgi:hypothetical protein